jgi:hypothetical protein
MSRDEPRQLYDASPGASKPTSLAPLGWLIALQLLSLLGIAWFWAMILGFADAGLWGTGLLAAIALTLFGCLIAVVGALFLLT